MTTAQLLIVCVTVLVAVMLVSRRMGAGGRAPELVDRTVVVHTSRPDDQSIRGIVHGDHVDRVILREAVYLHVGGAQEARGLVHVARARISSMQEIVLTHEAD